MVILGCEADILIGRGLMDWHLGLSFYLFFGDFLIPIDNHEGQVLEELLDIKTCFGWYFHIGDA